MFLSECVHTWKKACELSGEHVNIYVPEKLKRTTTIQKHTIEIEERGVKLRLTVIDTPGKNVDYIKNTNLCND